MQLHITGRRYLCPCWLCVLLIPEVEAHEGQLMDGMSVAVHRCGPVVLDVRPGPEILCVDVSP